MDHWAFCAHCGVLPHGHKRFAWQLQIWKLMNLQPMKHTWQSRPALMACQSWDLTPSWSTRLQAGQPRMAILGPKASRWPVFFALQAPAVSGRHIVHQARVSAGGALGHAVPTFSSPKICSARQPRSLRSCVARTNASRQQAGCFRITYWYHRASAVNAAVVTVRIGLRPGERFCSSKDFGPRNVTIVRTP
jgi:hypothetical protein